MTPTLPPNNAEWLEADGLGGFASGTVSGIRTRRYHGLLVPATMPPAGRTVLVNGFEAWVELEHVTLAISSQHYQPDVFYPDGANRLTSFRIKPWPTWTFQLGEGLAIVQELFAVHGMQTVAVGWKLSGPVPVAAKLRVRPLLSGRDFHATHHENNAFQFGALERADTVIWRPYVDLPSIEARTNGAYHHDPCWYRNFLYVEEQRRGLDCIEDLGSPGLFEWEISAGPAALVLSVPPTESDRAGNALQFYDSLRTQERARRGRFSSAEQLAVDAYIVKRGDGRTIIAGYPWFGDWGRDAFIALRGLCLTNNRLDDARQILVQWSSAVSEGMLPNRFPDSGETPEYNSVDSSLWYIIAVDAYWRSLESQSPALPASATDGEKLKQAINKILAGYVHGTRFGIRMDADGLLSCGQPGLQLTWMDAKVGDWVVTPRIGKPVEVQALWINALSIGSSFSAQWKELFDRAKTTFEDRFWNEARGCLFDVVDCDHQPGSNDPSLRPNQVFAVGGLPLQLIQGERASRIIEAVEGNLLTPIGLRSLAPTDPAYVPHYEGGVLQRDSSYHQGTVSPWLIGPFVEGWLRVRQNTAEAKVKAKMWFLPPLREHLREAGLNHISEIADAAPPHLPRGCPFQAWSMGEYLRLLSILGE